MTYYVYLIKSKNIKSKVEYTYVGYTNNLIERIKKHNEGKGAKFTKGKKWKLIYYEVFSKKIDAMKREYRLKKDNKNRNLIKKTMKLSLIIKNKLLF